MSEDPLTKIPESIVQKQAFAILLEVGEVEEHGCRGGRRGEPKIETPSVKEWEKNVESVGTKWIDDEFVVEFSGSVEGTSTRRISMGSKMQPPEYETEKHHLEFLVQYYPGRNDGLGDSTGEIGL